MEVLILIRQIFVNSLSIDVKMTISYLNMHTRNSLECPMAETLVHVLWIMALEYIDRFRKILFYHGFYRNKMQDQLDESIDL